MTDQQWAIETLPRPLRLPPSKEMGLCDRICPDHNRHCDAYGHGAERNYGHPGPHACALCDDWQPR